MDITKLTELATEESMIWLPKVVAVLFIIILFFLLAKFAKRIIIKLAKNLELDPHLTKFFAQASCIIFTLFSVITALGTVGINVSALVAGLGLTGFALGFVFKDTISNLLSGITAVLLTNQFIGK